MRVTKMNIISIGATTLLQKSAYENHLNRSVTAQELQYKGLACCKTYSGIFIPLAPAPSIGGIESFNAPSSREISTLKHKLAPTLTQKLKRCHQFPVQLRILILPCNFLMLNLTGKVPRMGISPTDL